MAWLKGGYSQRQQGSLSANIYTRYPYCRSRSIVKSATTMPVKLQRKLPSVARRLQTPQGQAEVYLN